MNPNEFEELVKRKLIEGAVRAHKYEKAAIAVIAFALGFLAGKFT